MLHRLTIGHLDPAAVQRRQTVPTKALEMHVVHRLLHELGETDADGTVTLGGCKVRFHNAALSCHWMGGKTNPVAEEFALRMSRETGCLLADVDCGMVIDPWSLAGLSISGPPDGGRNVPSLAEYHGKLARRGIVVKVDRHGSTPEPEAMGGGAIRPRDWLWAQSSSRSVLSSAALRTQ